MLFPTASLTTIALLASSIDARTFKRDAPPSAHPDARNVRRMKSGATVSSRYPVGQEAATGNHVTDNVLALSRTGAANKHSAYALSRTQKIARRDAGTTGKGAVLTSLLVGEEYSAPIIFGSTVLEVIVDTGSSDTWVVESAFQCVNEKTAAVLSQSDCAFGTTFVADPTFSVIADINFNITYGDGEFLSGIFGTENVTFCGINIEQQIALVTLAAWDGDSTTSGLVGLAYPTLTSAYEGNVPTNDTTQVIYDPIFNTMVKDNLVSSMFSMTIERNTSGPAGYLALGGLPPLDFVQNFTNTPIILTTIEDYPLAYDFYSIAIDSLTIGGVVDTGAAAYEYIVDSGTTLNFFPTAYADTIAKAYKPAATYSKEEEAYIVNCAAIAPTLAVTINGTAFQINPLDMILFSYTDDAGNKVCISGINDGGDTMDDVFILGNTFQKNVVMVFDVGASEMRFAGREFYASDDTY